MHFSRLLRRATRRNSPKASRRCVKPKYLVFEPLEPRLALSVAPGLVEVGAQPVGNLTGKIVYTHAGHGYTADTATGSTGGTGAWSFQRGLLLGMVEDLGNQDQMTFLDDYLLRAGATVVPLRPVGFQPNEAVLDNDDPGVTFTGAWSNSGSSVYYGSAGDVPYRFVTTSATETAVARYQPTLAAAGFYPVYAWTHYGSDRAADQLYRVNHSGGSTEVKVNHRRVGDGLVYLGTYHFDAGTAGSVEISNKSSEAGRTIIADMIRFGNGVGDIARSAGVSGRSREDEAGLYWVEWHVSRSQGIPTSQYRNSTNNDRNATISLSPRYAEYMNREQDGALSDRVFVSYHSNAAGGRGVLGLYNGNNDPTEATPNQFELAKFLGQEVNDDLVAQNGQFEFNWFNAGTNVTLDRSDIEFGEINNDYVDGEFDATIVEVAYHDDATDTALMRDPKVRDAVARATYQGIVRYFNSLDGGATSLTMLPGRVPQVRAEVIDADSVQLTWTAPAANAYNGDAATGYRIYGSTNGYGFDGGTFVAGGATTTFTLNGLSAAEGAYFFKVVAVNSGGEGQASEVVAAIPGDRDKSILIVNGFDRLTRQQNPTQAVPGGQAERVRPRQSNSFDYAVQFAAAIEANAPYAEVDTASNEMVAGGAVNLADYDAVIWISGEESTADDTFSAAEQVAVTNYLAGGGKLFVSGAEIGWDLDAQGGGAAFYNNQLKADYASDDANSYAASGVAGRIFAGLAFNFDNGAQVYNVDFPDVLVTFGGSLSALTYGTGGIAAIQHTDGGTGAQVVNFGFPFETITTAANRATVMDRILEFFGFDFTPTGDFDSSGRIDGADFLSWQIGFGKPATAALAEGDGDDDGAVDAADFALWTGSFGAPASVAAEAAALVIEGESAAMPAATFVPSPLLVAGEWTGRNGAQGEAAFVDYRRRVALGFGHRNSTGANELFAAISVEPDATPSRRRAAVGSIVGPDWTAAIDGALEGLPECLARGDR